MVICNSFQEELANKGKITTFTGVPLFDALERRFFLNLENQDLDRRNLRTMLKISYAASPYLPQLISAQFALEMCVEARNRQQKSIKLPILAFMVIQDH